MVQEGILGGAILTVAHLLERVTCPINLSAPVIGLDAEVVVGLLGHLALAHAALENALGERDAGRHAVVALMLQSDGLVALDIVQITLLFGLRRRRNGAKQRKKQAKMR